MDRRGALENGHLMEFLRNVKRNHQKSIECDLLLKKYK